MFSQVQFQYCQPFSSPANVGLINIYCGKGIGNEDHFLTITGFHGKFVGFEKILQKVYLHYNEVMHK